MTGISSSIFNYFTMQTLAQQGIFVPSPSQSSHCLSSKAIISRNKLIERVADPATVTKRILFTHSSSGRAEINLLKLNSPPNTLASPLKVLLLILFICLSFPVAVATLWLQHCMIAAMHQLAQARPTMPCIHLVICMYLYVHYGQVVWRVIT